MDSSSEKQLHIMFFPLMAHGHMIPFIDMARVFVRHGVRATIVTTPMNAPFFANVVESDKQKGFEISIFMIKFPCNEAGLPEGCENISSVTSKEMSLKFIKATSLLQEPFEMVVKECDPDCIVADVGFPWTSDVASKYGIPRVIFHGISTFALCVISSLFQHEPHKRVASDSEFFIVPGLPDQIEFNRQKLPDFLKEGCDEERVKMTEQVRQAEKNSYGVIMNSFQDLEPAYSKHYRKVIGKKAWLIGPVSLCNKDTQEKAQRGNSASTDQRSCLKWLDSKAPDSVIYISFGSIFRLSTDQARELAMGIEASGHHFIWVVREEAILPEGFEQRMQGKGLIIRGWAPQMLILDHDAVGGFMTHCGWNSVLESVSAGVPMLAWPVCAEQFFNEKLVTDVLRIGIAVGSQGWSRWIDSKQFSIGKENIENAIAQLMADEKTDGMRMRAKALKEMAERACQEGGSSYCDLKDFLDELKLKRK